MSDKVGKTFTIDLEVYAWLVKYCKDHHQKQSYVVNSILRRARKAFTQWACPECNATNDNRFDSCHDCDYVNTVDPIYT